MLGKNVGPKTGVQVNGNGTKLEVRPLNGRIFSYAEGGAEGQRIVIVGGVKCVRGK
jgi:hypothetical protein